MSHVSIARNARSATHSPLTFRTHAHPDSTPVAGLVGKHALDPVPFNSWGAESVKRRKEDEVAVAEVTDAEMHLEALNPVFTLNDAPVVQNLEQEKGEGEEDGFGEDAEYLTTWKEFWKTRARGEPRQQR